MNQTPALSTHALHQCMGIMRTGAVRQGALRAVPVVCPVAACVYASKFCVSKRMTGGRL
jgi:hypothetical protein